MRNYWLLNRLEDGISKEINTITLGLCLVSDRNMIVKTISIKNNFFLGMFLVFVFVLSCTEKANGTEHQAEPEPAESQLDQENKENRGKWKIGTATYWSL